MGGKGKGRPPYPSIFENNGPSSALAVRRLLFISSPPLFSNRAFPGATVSTDEYFATKSGFLSLSANMPAFRVPPVAPASITKVASVKATISLFLSIALSARQTALGSNCESTRMRCQSQSARNSNFCLKCSQPSGRIIMVVPPDLRAAKWAAVSTPLAYPETTTTPASANCCALSFATHSPCSETLRDPQKPTDLSLNSPRLPAAQIGGAAKSPKMSAIAAG